MSKGCITEAIKISNQIAPEHLELCVEDPESMLDGIKHAGAIFMGKNTCEAIGDYCAGPNLMVVDAITSRLSVCLQTFAISQGSSDFTERVCAFIRHHN
jgi:histidinol dehydrogenase